MQDNADRNCSLRYIRNLDQEMPLNRRSMVNTASYTKTAVLNFCAVLLFASPGRQEGYTAMGAGRRVETVKAINKNTFNFSMMQLEQLGFSQTVRCHLMDTALPAVMNELKTYVNY